MAWAGGEGDWGEEQLSTDGPVGGSTLLNPLPLPSFGTSVSDPGRRVLCGLYRGAVGYFAVFFFCWVFLFSSFFFKAYFVKLRFLTRFVRRTKVLVLVPGAATMGHVCYQGVDDGREPPILPRLAHASLCRRAQSCGCCPAGRSRGSVCSALAPCIRVHPDTHVHGAKRTCGCICVYVHSDVYTECVCVGVRVNYLNLRLVQKTPIWLNLSLRSEA